MNLESKVTAIIPAIKFISEHDDAPEAMVKAALESVRAMIDAEIADLPKRNDRIAAREKAKADRIAARAKKV